METNKAFSFAEVLKTQTDAFIEILKKQNDFFTETLRTNSNAVIELLKKAENELNQYRNSFDKKLTNETDESLSREISNASVDTAYFDLIDKYLEDYDRDVFVDLVERFPDKIFDILKASYNHLPKDIDEIAETFGFTENLEEIKERKRKFDLLKAEKSVNMKRSYADLCDDYEDAFLKKRPTLIKRYIKQMYVVYPDNFNKFLTEAAVNNHLPKNMEDLMNKIKKELKEKPPKKDVVESQEKGKRKEHVRIDYKNIAISELVELARNYKTNQRQFIQRCTWGLEKAKRSEADRIEFITQAKG